MYLAAFSGFADEWRLYAGQQSARINDEQLELTVLSPQTATWSTAAARFGDIDFRVEAKAVAGPIDNAFGLLLRFQDRGETPCDLPAVTLCGLAELSPLAGAALRQIFARESGFDYLAFLISSDGYYSLWKAEASSTRQVSAWMPSNHISQGLGASNIIRAVARGSRYRFYINQRAVELCLPLEPSTASTYYGGECIDGELQLDYVDEAPAYGKIGLVAQSTATGGGGVVVRFDNLLVFSPGAADNEDVKL